VLALQTVICGFFLVGARASNPLVTCKMATYVFWCLYMAFLSFSGNLGKSPGTRGGRFRQTLKAVLRQHSAEGVEVLCSSEQAYYGCRKHVQRPPRVDSLGVCPFVSPGGLPGTIFHSEVSRTWRGMFAPRHARAFVSSVIVCVSSSFL
jgi:hypothetical protein